MVSHSSGAVRAVALGIGTVSRNTVDATIEAAYETSLQLMLITSRNQIDLERLGSGYVEGWATPDLADYVRKRDPDSRVLLCRDHGGPWQHTREVEAGLDEESAMHSALASFTMDVEQGFHVLHIDTTQHLDGEASPGDAMSRLIRLYQAISTYAMDNQRPIAFEISFGAQQSGLDEPREFGNALADVLRRLDDRHLPRPTYVVAQTGTKVVGTRNVGAVARGRADGAVASSLRALVEVCVRTGVTLKAHNCDYLDSSAWKTLAASGVRSANVAPEYGVAETRTFLSMLEQANLRRARDRFLEIAYDSGRWRKWVARPRKEDDYTCAVMSGHYVFSMPEVREIREHVADQLGIGQEAMDARLRRSVKAVILRHLSQFRGRDELRSEART